MHLNNSVQKGFVKYIFINFHDKSQKYRDFLHGGVNLSNTLGNFIFVELMDSNQMIYEVIGR